MEGNGVRAVIMGLLILGLVVAQIEAKSCCRDTSGRNCYNVCRVPGTPRPTCAGICDCKIITESSCPDSHPRSGEDMLENSEASVYQTIITTTELFEEPNRPSQSERCRRQVSGMRFDSCRRYMQAYMLYPTYSPPGQQQCCQELRQVNDPHCRCEALQRVVQQVPGYGQQQQPVAMKAHQLAMKAQQLADQCGMQELRSCQIRGQQGY